MIFTFALIGCIAFIFSNSMQIASASTGASSRVLTLLQRALCRAGLPVLGGALTALADETIQLYSAGRSSQVTDVWLDLIGVLAGIFAAVLVLAVFRLVFHHRDKE